MARKPKDKAAPKAKPRERKNAMIAPAVSASCWDTFLREEHKTTESHLQSCISLGFLKSGCLTNSSDRSLTF